MNSIGMHGFKGNIYTPQDEGYEEAREPWLRNHDSRPAVVAEPVDTASIQAAVRYAGAHDLPIAIQSTGHGSIKPTDGAMLIKTGLLTQLSVDPDEATAIVEPGVMIGDIVNAASKYGLAPITGDSPYVGVMGFTLGGGHGWLSRQYGFAADSIIAARIVVASGEVLTASATENADLFWGLKGGSGNFGVVVSLTLRLHKVERGLAGTLYFDAKHAAILLNHYGKWALGLPEQYTAFLQAISLPPIPQLPESLRAKRVVALQLFFNDASQQSSAALDGFLQAVGVAPLENFVSRKSYAEFMAEAPNIPPTAALDVSGLQKEITAAQAADLSRYLAGDDGFAPIIQFRPWGGSLAKPAPGSLLQYDDVGYSIYATLSLSGKAGQSKARFTELSRHIAQYSSGKAFINFAADTEAMSNAYDRASLQRIAALKSRYDPNTLFRLGHTVHSQAVPGKK